MDQNNNDVRLVGKPSNMPALIGLVVALLALLFLFGWLADRNRRDAEDTDLDMATTTVPVETATRTPTTPTSTATSTATTSR